MTCTDRQIPLVPTPTSGVYYNLRRQASRVGSAAEAGQLCRQLSRFTYA